MREPWISGFFFAFFLIFSSIVTQPLYFPTATLPTTWINDESSLRSINFTDGSRIRVILLRTSGLPMFTCGFFCNGTCTSYLFAIIINLFMVVNPQVVPYTNKDSPEVIWSANRDNPVREGAILSLNEAGELVLHDVNGSIVWTTNTNGQFTAGMNLTDKGNLMLFDDHNSMVWQSFDHPTDCLVQGQKLFQGQKLIPSVSSTDWTAQKDLFSLQVTDKGLFAYVESNPPQVYFRKLVNGINPENYVVFLDRSLCLFIFSTRPNYCKSVIDIPPAFPFQFIKLMPDGHLKVFGWDALDGGARVADLLTGDLGECFYPLACGRNGICSSNQECSCPRSSFPGMDSFRAVNDSEPIMGCSQVNSSAFIKIQNVRSSPSFKVNVATVIGSTIGSLVLLIVVIGFIMFIVKKKKTDSETEEEYLDQVPGMPTRFSYEELKTSTKNFSKKLGEGGFGSVFEGTLEDGSRIAVKCLQGLVNVKKSFLAEVESIGSIHHVNLVRLRGVCAWRSERLLVYEFMSNGSLDQWIYHGDRKPVLEWVRRKKIILDIAKGLAYLHEDCSQKIIHLDIKPQNILLDEDFNAKVSDFGLAKLIDRNQSHVITTMRGTPGYMAPEWLSSIITEKMDVYSFGIVLLEILCGRKNFDRSQPQDSWHLLCVFQRCWEQGTLLDIVDRSSKDMQVNGAEVMEMMKVASWCLQTDFTKRPSMSSVVKVLEGVMNVESNLDYNFLYPRLQKITDEHEKNSKPVLPSILSGPR